MDSVLRDKWLLALRSGVFRRSHGRLRTFGCCGKSYPEPRFSALGLVALIGGLDFKELGHSADLLPEGFLGKDEQLRVFEMNKDPSYSWNDIASWVEKNIN